MRRFMQDREHAERRLVDDNGIGLDENRVGKRDADFPGVVPEKGRLHGRFL